MFTGPEGKIDNVSSKGKSTAHSQSKTGITFVPPSWHNQICLKTPSSFLLLNECIKTKQKSRFQKKIPMAFSVRIKFTS